MGLTEVPSDAAEGIRYAVQDGIATITLDRPHRRNAFTLEMIRAWVGHLRRADEDPDVCVVVLRGAGDGFCSGIDLDALAGLERPLDHVLTEQIHAVARAVEALDKPLVAAVRGPAVGAGMDMALMCDVRIADTTASFCEKYVDVGILPGDGGAWLLPRAIGHSRGLLMLMTGMTVSAVRAHEWGLVDLLVEDGELDHAVAELGETLRGKRDGLVSRLKSVVRAGRDQDLLTALNYVAREQRRLRRPSATSPGDGDGR